MARQLTWLSDAEWCRIEPLLPRGRKGAHRVDDRRVISGIVHMLRIGARWRDCPLEYGPYTTHVSRDPLPRLRRGEELGGSVARLLLPSLPA
jgi:transposase